MQKLSACPVERKGKACWGENMKVVAKQRRTLVRMGHLSKSWKLVIKAMDAEYHLRRRGDHCPVEK